MVFRQTKSGDRVYRQIVENRWEQGRSKQRVIATLGRLDRLSESGQLDALLQSAAKFCESVMVLAAHREGETSAVSTRRIGPAQPRADCSGGADSTMAPDAHCHRRLGLLSGPAPARTTVTFEVVWPAQPALRVTDLLELDR